MYWMTRNGIPLCSKSGAEYAHHSRMVDPRQGFHFLLKFLPHPRIGVGLFQEHLDDDKLVRGLDGS